MIKEQAIRILLLADTHLGFDSPQKPRIVRRRRGSEFFANYRQALKTATSEGVDLVVHGGDLFYRSRIPDSLINQAFEPLLDLAEKGIPVFLVPGNHERSALRPTLFDLHPDLHIFDRPRTFRLDIRGRVLALSGFPCCRKGVAHIFSKLVHQSGFRDRPADLNLICLHQSVEGAQVGVQNYTFRTGPDIIPGQALPPADAILAGHIHRHQILNRDLQGRPLAAPVFFPGSIDRTSFAEQGEDKGFLLLEFGFHHSRPRPLLRSEFRPSPCRPMIDLPVSADRIRQPRAEAYLQSLLADLDPDSIVRLNFQGDLSTGAPAILKAESLRRIAPSSMTLSINWRSFRSR